MPSACSASIDETRRRLERGRARSPGTRTAAIVDAAACAGRFAAPIRPEPDGAAFAVRGRAPRLRSALGRSRCPCSYPPLGRRARASSESMGFRCAILSGSTYRAPCKAGCRRATPGRSMRGVAGISRPLRRSEDPLSERTPPASRLRSGPRAGVVARRRWRRVPPPAARNDHVSTDGRGVGLSLPRDLLPLPCWAA